MKFEYNYLYPINREGIENSIAVMKDMGRDEWELVSVDNGIAYFKRPLRSKSEDEIMKHFETVSWPPERKSLV